MTNFYCSFHIIPCNIMTTFLLPKHTKVNFYSWWSLNFSVKHEQNQPYLYYNVNFPSLYNCFYYFWNVFYLYIALQLGMCIVDFIFVLHMEDICHYVVGAFWSAKVSFSYDMYCLQTLSYIFSVGGNKVLGWHLSIYIVYFCAPLIFKKSV